MLPLWGNDIVRLRHTVLFCSPSVGFICARFECKHHAAYAAHHCEATSLAEGEQGCALRAHKPQFIIQILICREVMCRQGRRDVAPLGQ